MAGPLIFTNPAHAGIQEDLRTRLERAAAAYGAPLTITSGLAGRPTTPGSMHPHGRASDLSMAGMDEAARLRLAQTLRDQGVRRFGTYTNNPDMLHVDMSDAQGGNHYMHDKTRRNLERAPGWFRDFAGGAGPDVRQAAAAAGMSTDTDRTMTGDPMTGRAYSSPQETPMLPPLPPMTPYTQEAPQEVGNPLLQTLMRVALGTAVAGGGNIGAGAILAGSAMRDSELAENELYTLKAKKQEQQRKDALMRHGAEVAKIPGLEDVGSLIMVDPAAGYKLYAERAEMQRTQAQRQAMANALRQQGLHAQAALIEAGGTPGAINMNAPGGEEYFAPVPMVDPNDPTKFYMAQFSKTGQPRAWKPGPDGQWVPTDPAEVAGAVPAAPGAPGGAPPAAPGAPGGAVPASVWGKMPTTAGQVQEAKDTAKNAVEAKEGYTEALAAIDKGRNTIARLSQMPGRTSATGWQAGLPYTWPGGEASNYQILFDQFKGENFLTGIPQMKGMGALSNAEGDAIRQAQSYANLSLSDVEHEWALATAYANLNRAEQRIKTRKLLGPGEDPPAATQEEIQAAADALFGAGRQPAAGLRERHSNPKSKAKITEIK